MDKGPSDSSRIAELHINKIDETVGIYAFAYLDAAAQVFAHGICDFAPYPGMYCLRHGLELFVKQVAVYVAYEMRDTCLLYRKGHAMLATWDAVKSHVEDACGPNTLSSDCISQESLDALDGVIRELHDLDPSGMLFRYPEDLVKGKGRIDTHFPADRFNLRDWQHIAEEALTTCQAVEWELGKRCSLIQSSRNEFGTSLYDLLTPLSDNAT